MEQIQQIQYNNNFEAKAMILKRRRNFIYCIPGMQISQGIKYV